MPIQLADDAIREARLIIAQFDRKIAERAKVLRASKNEHSKHLRRELRRLRCERAKAYNELLELAKMPTELMGTA
jgi:hypothetical protein